MVIKIDFMVNSEPVKKLDRQLINLHRRFENLTKSGPQGMRDAVNGVSSAVTKMAVGFGAATAGLGLFLNEAGNFNKTRIAFQTMVGDIDKGNLDKDNLKGNLSEIHISFFNFVTELAKAIQFSGNFDNAKKIVPLDKYQTCVISGLREMQVNRGYKPNINQFKYSLVKRALS